MIRHLSAALPMPARVPPIFALIAGNDPLFARDDFALIDAWRKAGAPVEFHFLQNGGHGFGLGRTRTSSSDWIELFHHWLDVNEMLNRHP